MSYSEAYEKLIARTGTYEVEGRGKAYDYMFSLVKNREVTEKDILACHLLFSKNISDFINQGE
ncbi:MAG: hypothetical protein LBH42_04890 [Treponema sp.]|jgi:hypothetical protein|nr:hypothetical protein [Treponema sp.]